MQGIESTSVQRRPMDVEDYIDILRRHRAWILGPAFLGLVIGVVVAFLWPNTYVSSAVLRVVPSQIPDKYVPTNVNAQMAQRINWIYTQILSRSTLTNIIQVHNLYPEERAKKPMDDVVEDMRKNLSIRGAAASVSSRRQQESPAFEVRFYYRNRFLAQRVTQDLVSRIIDENIRARQEQSESTTEFLREQVAASRKTMDEIDKKITDYRMRNIGQTPEQLAMNYQQLNAKEMRIASLNSAIARLNQEKVVLESDLRTLRDRLKALAATPPERVAAAAARQGGSDQLNAVDREIMVLETQLAGLRQRYTDTHPDVVRRKNDLGVLRKTRENIVKQEEARKPPEPEVQGQPRINPVFAKEAADLEGQINKTMVLIQNKDFEVEEYQKELTALNRATRAYQARIEASPVGEQEFHELMRERQIAQDHYAKLSVNMAQSEMATDMEQRKQSELLDLLDAASLPQSPELPNRPMIVGMGFAAGFTLGLMLAGAREVKDSALKNLKDVRAYTKLAILGSVPLLENDIVVRRRRRIAWVAWSMVILVGCAIMAGALYYYEFVAKV